MTWYGEIKRHSDVQLKADLKDLLRQPIQIVKKIEDKGYPTSDSDYLSSHKLAEAAEKSIFGTDSFNKLEQIIRNKLPEGQLLGTHKNGKPIQISSIVPKEFISQVLLHEAVEMKLMNADGGTDIDLFVNGKTSELIQNGKPIAIRTDDFVFITKDLSPNQIPDLYKKLNTTYSGGSVSLGLKSGHVIIKNINAEIKKHELAISKSTNDLSKRMHVQILTALKQLNGSTKTNEFRDVFRKELTRLRKDNKYDTTIIEFQRWLKEDLISFDQKSLYEQVTEKIDYEIDIGNDSKLFKDIEAFIDIWLGENEDPQDDYIWYHGTTGEKYNEIKKAGEIKVSTKDTFQHSGFERDIGTVSLAKMHGMAQFFSALSGKGSQNQIVLHIDTRHFDPVSISKRKLINTPDGEMLYRKSIPVSAIIKAETVYRGA